MDLFSVIPMVYAYPVSFFDVGTTIAINPHVDDKQDLG